MKKFGLILVTLGLIAGGGGLLWLNRTQNPASTSNSQNKVTATTPGEASAKKPSFNKQQYSLDDPASIWVVVNKKRPFNPKSYAPANLVTPTIPLRSGSGSQEMKLRKDAAAALETMTAAAAQEGLKLMLASGYRSYTLQVSVYNNEVKTYGQEKADQESARPGHSEHQTGLAADIEPASRTCEVQQCFATTPEGKWLAANAYKYGFVIRYADGKQGTTGYMYEPWHVRFVGADLATEMYNQGVSTLEEFFGLPAAPNY